MNTTPAMTKALAEIRRLKRVNAGSVNSHVLRALVRRGLVRIEAFRAPGSLSVELDTAMTVVAQ